MFLRSFYLVGAYLDMHEQVSVVVVVGTSSSSSFSLSLAWLHSKPVR